MKVIDLFCGVGGLSLGFEQAGFEVVASVDLWQDAIKTYNHNRTNKSGIVMPVDKFNQEVLPGLIKENRICGVIGGPPCQGFSTVGKRDVNDNRNKLYLDFYDCVKLSNPDFFVMENVKGMLTLNKGSFVRSILDLFGPNGLGYNIFYKVLNAADYGIPQNRQRVFFVGVKNNNFEFLLLLLLEYIIKSLLLIKSLKLFPSLGYTETPAAKFINTFLPLLNVIGSLNSSSITLLKNNCNSSLSM